MAGTSQYSHRSPWTSGTAALKSRARTIPSTIHSNNINNNNHNNAHRRDAALGPGHSNLLTTLNDLATADDLPAPPAYTANDGYLGPARLVSPGRDTGLESIFDRVFSLGDEPSEVRAGPSAANTPARDAPGYQDPFVVNPERLRYTTKAGGRTAAGGEKGVPGLSFPPPLMMVSGQRGGDGEGKGMARTPGWLSACVWVVLVVGLSAGMIVLMGGRGEGV